MAADQAVILFGEGRVPARVGHPELDAPFALCRPFNPDNDREKISNRCVRVADVIRNKVELPSRK